MIAAAWGGHLSSVDSSAGILVDVTSRAALVHGLANAMVVLAQDAELRARSGASGRRLVEERYDWNVIVDQTLDAYREVTSSGLASAHE